MQFGGRGNDEATRLGARPGKAERRTSAERPSRPLPRRAPRTSPRGGAAHQPPPPPPRLTHQRPTRPCPAPGAATQPRLSMQQEGMRGATLPAMKGGQGRGPQTTTPEEGGEEPRRRPPPPLPPLPPLRPAGCRRRATEAPALYPPKGQGEVPPPLGRTGGGRGGTPQSQYATRPHASPACSDTDRDGQADSRQHTRVPHRPHPGSTREHESEQYGGHPLHPLSDANNTRFGARPGKAEGWTEVERPPAPRGPPATPPGRTPHKPPPPPAPLGLETPRTRGPAHKGAHKCQARE